MDLIVTIKRMVEESEKLYVVFMDLEKSVELIGRLSGMF